MEDDSGTDILSHLLRNENPAPVLMNIEYKRCPLFLAALLASGQPLSRQALTRGDCLGNGCAWFTESDECAIRHLFNL
jgi:hypothetical protein